MAIMNRKFYLTNTEVIEEVKMDDNKIFKQVCFIVEFVRLKT